jgi:hypothetical protein
VAANEKKSSTFQLSPESRRDLQKLKADLQYEGLHATQEAIVDELIRRADLAVLRVAFAEAKPKPRGRAATRS